MEKAMEVLTQLKGIIEYVMEMLKDIFEGVK